jgi:ubiquinone/menaquinone biosynthesis C-methylase UbiE
MGRAYHRVVPSSYDSIASLYDPWSASVKEDVDFYVVEARKAGGPIIELGVGTGRIAVPTAEAGIHVIGVDSSEGMLAICRERAEGAGVSELLDLRLGDLRRPPVRERANLVTCPFRALLHLQSDEERLDALRAVYRRSPGRGSSSTSSPRAARTSRRRTPAGSSASRGSGSGRSGTSTGGSSR